MCITEAEIDNKTDDSGAAAVGIVGAACIIIGGSTAVSGNIGGWAGICIGIAVIGIAAWMIVRKM